MSKSSCHNLADKEITASELEIMSKPYSPILADDMQIAVQNKDIKVVVKASFIKVSEYFCFDYFRFVLSLMY